MYNPFNYQDINIAEGMYNPSQIKPYNNQAFDFWVRSLFQRATYKIQFENLPKQWQGSPYDFFIWCLYIRGYVSVFDSDEFGIAFQPCTLRGYNFYYQPTQALITNPLLKENLELTIGRECEIIKLTPDYRGIYDIICYYAEKLALIDNSINVSITNSKVPFILGAKTKASAQALKKMLDKINKGEPAVIYDQRIENDAQSKDTPFQLLERNNIKNGYITSDLLNDFQTIINDFDCEIGIATIPYEKKERLVSGEADSKKEDSIARCTVWLETIKNSLTRVNEMFGTNISVKLRESEVQSDETLDTRDRELSQSADTE